MSPLAIVEHLHVVKYAGSSLRTRLVITVHHELGLERVKPSRGVKPGDTVTFTRSAVVFECVVAAVPLRRGPASEAARCYEETPASKARREDFATRMKVAAGLSPRPDDRPDKHERRLLRQLRGRN